PLHRRPAARPRRRDGRAALRPGNRRRQRHGDRGTRRPARHCRASRARGHVGRRAAACAGHADDRPHPAPERARARARLAAVGRCRPGVLRGPGSGRHPGSGRGLLPERPRPRWRLDRRGDSMTPERRVAIVTLGCKVNAYDSAAIADRLRAEGCVVVPPETSADVVVVNSCTVTDAADAESRRLARRARRLNPHARVILTGCYAQTRPEEAAAVEAVDHVIGLNRLDDLAWFVAAIAEQTLVPRLRLSSIDPHEVSELLLRVMADAPTVCHHLHVPLQSADDGVLARMRRRYDGGLARERLAMIRALLPD